MGDWNTSRGSAAPSGVVRRSAVYISGLGHKSGEKVAVWTADGQLHIEGKKWLETVSLADVASVRIEQKDHVSAGRFLMLGFASLALKGKQQFLTVAVRQGVSESSIVLGGEPDSLDRIQHEITTAAAPGASALEQLERLAKLHESGALSDEEFEQQKRPLLARMNGD